MAVDKLVDSAQLNAALAATADAIRAKTGSSVSLPWNLSTGFQTAVADIPSGGDDGALVTRTASTYSNASVTSIGNYAFYMYLSLAAIDCPAVTEIKSHAFWGCGFSTISFPAATSVGVSAFGMCLGLQSVNLPAAVEIGSSAFTSCGVVSVNLPAAVNLGGSAFASCSRLTTISAPAVETIGDKAFYQCSALTAADFPMATTLGANAFGQCSALTAADFPNVKKVSLSAFYSCAALETAIFPAVETISASAFWRCFNLTSLYLTGSSVCVLTGSNALTSTPIAGYSASAGQLGSIYVPASLVMTYQSATNWVYFSSRFVGLTDAEIAALEGTA